MVASNIVYQDGKVIVSITGLEELNQRLDKMRNDLARRLLVEAMKKSLKGMLNRAESMVNIGKPVDLFGRPRKTGRLKGGFKIIKVKDPDPYSLNVNLINTAYTARWVEYGHRLLRRDRNGKKVPRKPGFVRARPFMRPAFEAHKQEAVDTLSKLIGAALTRRGF